MATVLPNVVLVGRLQRLESLVTNKTEVNHLSLSSALSPHTDPIQQQHKFPHKPALNIFRSRCQQTSTSLLVLLKSYPCLEGDVADGTSDTSACNQLAQVSVLQYFCMYSCHSGCTVLANRTGLWVAYNSWCLVCVYLYNVVVKLLLGQALGCLHTGLGSSSPRFQNNDRFEIIHKLQKSDRCYKTLIFRCLSSWQNLKN